MSSFHSVVTEQRVFICAVCAFIDKLLRAVLPDIAWDNTHLPTEEEFGGILDAVIARHDPKTSCEGDCCLAMAQAACNRLKRVCDLLKRVSASVEMEDIAKQYLDAHWFVDVLLRKNFSKLNKLYYTIDFTDGKPSRILTNVAAILNDKAVPYDSMDANAKRKATNDTKKIIAEVQKLATGVDSIHQHIDESKAELATKIDDGNKMIAGKVETMREEMRETKESLLARADAIIKKLGSVNLNGKRNGRHTAEQKKVCLACWELALENEELKNNTETGKATYPAAFNWYKSKLALVDVTTAKKFIAVMRTINNTNSANSIKELEAKQEAARKAAKKSGVQTAKKCGIMRAVKKTSRCAFAIAAATIGVLASPLRSDASPMPLGGGSPLSRNAA